MLRLSGTLLIVALACGLVLAIVYRITFPVIQEQRQKMLEQSLQSVFPAQGYEKQGTDMVYYAAKDADGDILGWCVPLSGKGYGGAISMLVGVDKTGAITGVKVLEHKETPGLGSQISEIGYKKTEAEFLAQFRGKKIADLILVKGKSDANIQAITGATISSKAVVETLREKIGQFLQTQGAQ